MKPQTGLLIFAIGAILALVLFIGYNKRNTELKNTQRDVCINNLRIFDAAENQWAMENHKTTNDVPTLADLQPYMRNDPNTANCPAGGTYTIGHVGQEPTCSIPDHKLQ